MISDRYAGLKSLQMYLQPAFMGFLAGGFHETFPFSIRPLARLRRTSL
jgi:hypothetical protein